LLLGSEGRKDAVRDGDLWLLREEDAEEKTGGVDRRMKVRRDDVAC
jgi:hypothetical protein